jgi:predicted Zn-dependent protease
MLNPISLFSRRSHRRWLYPLLSLVVATSVSVGTPQVSQAFPWGILFQQGVQLFQLTNVSDQQEIQLGHQINQQLLSSEIRLYQNRDINRYVNEIGQRLAKSSDRPNLPYTFQVVNDKNINAFATMGGYVYINTGTLAAADNEAQLASVIAHEIGHIASRHAIKQMRQTALAQGLSAAAGLDNNKAVQIGVEVALRLPNSRRDELEADQKGLVTLGRAGYAQSAMPAFMQKLLNSSSVPSFLSDHPATSDRIAIMKKAIGSTNGNVGGGLDSAAYKSKIRALIGS